MKRPGRPGRTLGWGSLPQAPFSTKRATRGNSATRLLLNVAGHDAVWLGVAAALGASGGQSARRAALRGIGSVAIVAALDRALAKPAARPVVGPLRGIVPRPGAAPRHANPVAPAAAFTTAVAAESPRHGLAVLPFAAGLTYLRGRGNLPHRGRAVAGIVAGASAALLTYRWWPAKPDTAAAAAPPRKPAPPLKDGKGLHLVVNPSSGISWSQDTATLLPTLLPEATITVLEPGDDLMALLDGAALRALADGGALGVCGGDGTVNAAGATAARHHVPLAVFPGGTFNHFAGDLGNQTMEDVARAVRDGEAVTADAGRATPPAVPRDGGPQPGVPGEATESPDNNSEQQLFLNTFSIGVYSELVHARERLEKRIGKWPALAVGLAKVLATGSPLSVAINGRPRRIWLLFAGNGIYHPAGFAPTYRTQLDDGLLDIRAVEAGTPLARTRLLLAVLTGTLHNSRVLTTAQVRRLELHVREGDPHFAYDGEVTEATYRHLVLDKITNAITLYRPADQSQWLR